MDLSRRELLTWGAGASLLALAPWPVKAARVLLQHTKPLKTLWLHNVHTGETLKRTYWEKGVYNPCALEDINKILRDYRTGEVIAIDKRVLDLVTTLQHLLNYNKPLDVISGYRSPKTNAMLARMGRKVDSNSYHMKGQAIDIHFRGLPLVRARDAARSLKKGGVGYYPRDGFIHVDVRGTPKYW